MRRICAGVLLPRDEDATTIDVCDADKAPCVQPLALHVPERLQVVTAHMLEAEEAWGVRCPLCHCDAGAREGHVCNAWVRVRVCEDVGVGAQPQHECLAYVELAVLDKSLPPCPAAKLRVCVAGEQQVLQGVLNGVALAACLSQPGAALELPDVCTEHRPGASLLSLLRVVSHYCDGLALDTSARAALTLHVSRLALSSSRQPLEVDAAPSTLLHTWRALLQSRLFSPFPSRHSSSRRSYVARMVSAAAGGIVSQEEVTGLFSDGHTALAHWPDAFFSSVHTILPRAHEPFATAAQRQRGDLLALEHVLQTLGTEVIGKTAGARAVVAEAVA